VLLRDGIPYGRAIRAGRLIKTMEPATGRTIDAQDLDRSALDPKGNDEGVLDGQVRGYPAPFQLGRFDRSGDQTMFISPNVSESDARACRLRNSIQAL
jgi:hypothetical protein